MASAQACWVPSVPWAQGGVSLRGADLGSCGLLPGADTWPELTWLEGSLCAQAECVTYPTIKATCGRQGDTQRLPGQAGDQSRLCLVVNSQPDTWDEGQCGGGVALAGGLGCFSEEGRLRPHRLR